MSRFRFRLQPVLDVRERVVDERQRDLALKKRELIEAEAALAALEAERDAERAALMRDHRSFGVDELRAAYAHLAYLDRAIEDQAVRVRACCDEVDPRSSHARGRQHRPQSPRDAAYAPPRRLNADVAQAEQREVDDQNARRYGRAQTERGERS